MTGRCPDRSAGVPPARRGKWSPIGVIRTPWSRVEDVPIQGAAAPETEGSVVVFDEFVEGLRHIEGFSHLILLYLFDRAGPVHLTRRPFLDDDPHGLFAIRHPARPNPIGLTVVALVSRDGAALAVRGVDMLDRTPLLDIKPYVARWDAFPDARSGWLDGKADRAKPEGRE